MQPSADISRLMREREAKIKVRDNTASDNHYFSQSAIKNPRMPNQARLQSYTNQHITASDLLLQQQTTSDDKTGNEGGIYDTGATGQRQGGS